MSANSTKALKTIADQLPARRKQVYKMLEKYPNSTFYDIAYKLGWNVNKVSNRFNELASAGFIKKTGVETRGDFDRDQFTVINDINIITDLQNQLFVKFRDSKSELERDFQKCETKSGKELIRKRIDYYKAKISNLKTLIP